MMYRTERPAAWSQGGVAAAAFMAAQIAAAAVAATGGWHVGSVSLGLSAGVTIAGVIVVTRCRIPGGIKAMLVAGGCGALLTLVATQDLIGLREVEHNTAAAMSEPGQTAPRVPRTAPIAVTATDPASEPAARALAADIDRRLPSGGDVTVAATVTDGAAGTRVSWAVVRGADRLWCGFHTERAAAGDVRFAMLADRMAAATRRSQAGALDCA